MPFASSDECDRSSARTGLTRSTETPHHLSWQSRRAVSDQHRHWAILSTPPVPTSSSGDKFLASVVERLENHLLHAAPFMHSRAGQGMLQQEDRVARHSEPPFPSCQVIGTKEIHLVQVNGKD